MLQLLEHVEHLISWCPALVLSLTFKFTDAIKSVTYFAN